MLHTEPAFEGIDHIGITVADLERSIAFWERMLGEPGRDRRPCQTVHCHAEVREPKNAAVESVVPLRFIERGCSNNATIAP